MLLDLDVIMTGRQERGRFCGGRYRVTTAASEMKMSHWIDAPVVERLDLGTTVLDLSDDPWDLARVAEDGDDLVLVMTKYPGRTRGVEVRILAGVDRYAIGGRVVSQEELMATLRALP